MSEEALEIYVHALREQHNRNEARRIRTRVSEARGNPHPAGIRWPFELLQNALDAGPRFTNASVSIRFRREPSRVIFEHDGAPFTSSELAALLSGGSSKEFDSEITTGRFGTGFLVTHVLAERTTLRGLLKVPNGHEQFVLFLNRGGDEDAILENIHSCNEAIRAATPLSDVDSTVPSASFEYPLVDDNSLNLGIDALRRALPYLYATRPSLGRVSFEDEGGGIEVWTPRDYERRNVEGGCIDSRFLYVDHPGKKATEIHVHRFTHEELAGASAIVLVERTDENWKIRLPEPDAPRVYREYPLRGSSFLPINIILDGKFGPDQERSKLLMGDADKKLLSEALSAAILAVKYAFDQNWEGAHQLASAWKPTTAFDPANAEEIQWWVEQLAIFAKRLSTLSIVQCDSKILPAATTEDEYADFIVPRLSSHSDRDETSVDRLWPLVAEATDLEPPRQQLSQDWTIIAEGWHGLGVQLSRITVSDLARNVRANAKTLDQLRVEGNHKDWLTRFLDIVGECWTKRAGIDVTVLGGLLPNQNQRLCSPADLRRDSGVSDRLKDICANMGHDVRNQLLLGGFDDAPKSDSLTYIVDAIQAAVPNSVSEDEIIEGAVAHLDDALPEDEICDETTEDAQCASVRLLDFLNVSGNRSAAAIARRLPLITSRKRAVRWSHDRRMMAPVKCWHESARPFAGAYPPDRVLSGLYAGSNHDCVPDCIPCLIAWGVAIADPISSDSPSELKERRLAAISSSDTDGIVVSGQTLTQIALLQPEVLNRCQEGIEEARALLGLVLCHVAPHDSTWREFRVLKGRKSGEDVEVSVRGALWLADLKVRAWVPVPGEDGKPIKMIANAATLQNLLDYSWLEGNEAAIRLLSDCFDFDELELRLLGFAPDMVARKELRDSLAKLLVSGGADPSFYVSLAADVESQQRRRRDVERCRRLGLAVQEAVKLAMEAHDLKLQLIDRGFDYEVALTEGGEIEDTSMRFEAGPYLLEIKATTTGRPRLTPMQAATAAQVPGRYVLCVVDLRNLTDNELDSEWSVIKVKALAKVVVDIGSKVERTFSLIDVAKKSSVAIKNETALRYEVPLAVWEVGSTIDKWVAAISAEKDRGSG